MGAVPCWTRGMMSITRPPAMPVGAVALAPAAAAVMKIAAAMVSLAASFSAALSVFGRFVVVGPRQAGQGQRGRQAKRQPPCRSFKHTLIPLQEI